MTVTDLCALTGLSRTSVGTALKTLLEAGAISRDKATSAGPGRQPDRWSVAAQPTPEIPHAPESGDASGTGLEDLADSADAPSSSERPSALESTGQSAPVTATVTPTEPSPAPGTPACAGDPPRVADREPDTAAVGADEPDHKPDVEASSVTLLGQAPTDVTQLPKLAKGQLTTQVLAFLNAHPDQDWSPHQVAVRLGGRSSGAISNALHKATQRGQIVQTNPKPSRYRAHQPAALPPARRPGRRTGDAGTPPPSAPATPTRTRPRPEPTAESASTSGTTDRASGPAQGRRRSPTRSAASKPTATKSSAA